MRMARRYINEDGSSNIQSSFLSCQKDTELILKKLFIDSYPYSDDLKRLLIINTKDCLTDRTNEKYLEVVNDTSLGQLAEDGYVRFVPRISLSENEEVKSYILISYDKFYPNETNSYYRDCVVMIDIICHIDCWDLGNFETRPLKIAGYIDGILNNTKLSGIGKFNFVACSEVVLSENLAGYCLTYKAIHGDDDAIEPEEEVFE
nr:MAG TPA: hypothetical protein [Caudoviricetes sp.]